MKTTNHSNNQSRNIAIFLIASALIFNTWFFGKIFSPTGEIPFFWLKLGIYGFQTLLLAIGLFILIKRPFISTEAVKNLRINLTVFLVTLVIGLVIAELVMRQMFPVSQNLGLEKRIPHEILGWSLLPNHSYLQKMKTGNFTITYNSKGWRDTEHSFQKKDSSLRVLILGDSFMEAYSVELENSIARQLEKLAKAKNYNIEVVNLGVSGYGTMQEYLAYENYGVQYEPDIVLLAFYPANDVRNNSLGLEKRGERPCLDESDTTQWKIIPSDYKKNQKTYEESKDIYLKSQKHWTGQSALIQQMLNAIDNINIARHQKPINLKNFAIDLCDEAPSYTQGWLTTQRIFHKLSQAVKK